MEGGRSPRLGIKTKGQCLVQVNLPIWLVQNSLLRLVSTMYGPVKICKARAYSGSLDHVTSGLFCLFLPLMWHILILAIKSGDCFVNVMLHTVKIYQQYISTCTCV